MVRLILAALIMLLPLELVSQEAVVVLRSTVKGNQEQPKVMYIVPWQRPGDNSLEYQPMESLVNELFTPVDRGEFVRELHYRERLSIQKQPEVTK